MKEKEARAKFRQVTIFLQSLHPWLMMTTTMMMLMMMMLLMMMMMMMMMRVVCKSAWKIVGENKSTSFSSCSLSRRMMWEGECSLMMITTSITMVDDDDDDGDDNDDDDHHHDGGVGDDDDDGNMISPYLSSN